MLWFLDPHELRQAADPKTLIDTSFTTDAVKRLGPHS